MFRSRDIVKYRRERERERERGVLIWRGIAFEGVSLDSTPLKGAGRGGRLDESLKTNVTTSLRHSTIQFMLFETRIFLNLYYNLKPTKFIPFLSFSFLSLTLPISSLSFFFFSTFKYVVFPTFIKP